MFVYYAEDITNDLISDDRIKASPPQSSLAKIYCCMRESELLIILINRDSIEQARNFDIV